MISPLSPEFLYYVVRNRPGDWILNLKTATAEDLEGWNQGCVHSAAVVAALQRYGVCEESSYPQIPQTDIPADTFTGLKPPQAAYDQALKLAVWNWETFDNTVQHAGAAESLYRILASERPAVVSVPEFTDAATGLSYWDAGDAQQLGLIDDPPANWEPDDRLVHGLCVIGYTPDAQGGWFAFRNSVGPLRFGSAGSPQQVPPVKAPGFGNMSAAFLNRYCYQISSPYAALSS